MNTIISFEIAKLLREKEFDLHCNYFFDEEGECVQAVYFRNHNDSSVHIYSAPIISDIIMWLYDKYNYSIEHSMNIPQSGEQDGCYVFNGIVKGAENYKLVIHYSSENLSSIKKAYEVAIEYTLKNLL